MLSHSIEIPCRNPHTTIAMRGRPLPRHCTEWCFVVVAGARVIVAIVVAGACILVIVGECILVARGGALSSLQGRMRHCHCRRRCCRHNEQQATLLSLSQGGDDDNRRCGQEDNNHRRGFARGGTLLLLQGRMRCCRRRRCCWGMHPRRHGGVHPCRMGWCCASSSLQGRMRCCRRRRCQHNEQQATSLSSLQGGDNDDCRCR